MSSNMLLFHSKIMHIAPYVEQLLSCFCIQHDPAILLIIAAFYFHFYFDVNYITMAHALNDISESSLDSFS